MNNTLNLLFDEVEGKWIYHQTFYCLINKVIKINKQNIYITKLNSLKKQEYINRHNYYIYEYKKSSNKKFVSQYSYKENSIPTSGIIQKIENSIKTKYDFKSYEKKYLKVSYNKKEVKYCEYIYTINNNLRISIIIIKKLNKYLAISFTSQIKIKL